MKIAIVDDEKSWIELEKKYVLEYWEEEVEILTYDSGTSFLEAERKFDLVLIDIEMPEINGFDTIREYREWNPKGAVIIVTKHVELSREGFKVDAFRYIDKAQIQEEMKEAIRAVKRYLRGEQKIPIGIEGFGKVRIALKQIRYFKMKSGTLILYASRGEHICMETLSQLENCLNRWGFFRVNPSCLVNFECVISYTDKEICMEKGEKIPLSKGRYKEWEKNYTDWNNNTVRLFNV